MARHFASSSGHDRLAFGSCRPAPVHLLAVQHLDAQAIFISTLLECALFQPSWPSISCDTAHASMDKSAPAAWHDTWDTRACWFPDLTSLKWLGCRPSFCTAPACLAVFDDLAQTGQNWDWSSTTGSCQPAEVDIYRRREEHWSDCSFKSTATSASHIWFWTLERSLFCVWRTLCTASSTDCPILSASSWGCTGFSWRSSLAFGSWDDSSTCQRPSCGTRVLSGELSLSSSLCASERVWPWSGRPVVASSHRFGPFRTHTVEFESWSKWKVSTQKSEFNQSSK